MTPRRYVKRRPRETGVYRITNLVNQKYYIGISTNLEQRLGDHRNDLISGLHPNRYLQRAWNKYGEDNFSFEVVKICSQQESVEEEQRALQSDFDNTYNISMESIIGRNPFAGLSEEHRRHLSQQASIRHKHYHANLSDEEKLLRSQRASSQMKDLWSTLTEEERREKMRPLNDRVISNEERQKRSETLLGRPKTDSHRESLRIARQRYLESHDSAVTEETRQKMSATRTRIAREKREAKELAESLMPKPPQLISTIEIEPEYIPKKVVSEETKEKIRQARLGKKHSPESRQKMSDSNRGKRAWSPERRQRFELKKLIRESSK